MFRAHTLLLERHAGDAACEAASTAGGALGTAWSQGQVKQHLLCIPSVGVGSLSGQRLHGDRDLSLRGFQANREQEVNIQIPGQNVMCVTGEIQRSHNVQRVEENY